MPIDMPAMPLWIKMAKKILKADEKSVHRPRASPSKKECTDSATIIMKPEPLLTYFYSS
jgi:hypothetical protein